MLQIYGLNNCDTTKKALTFLRESGTSFQFHDYKTEGADEDKIREWLESDNGKTLLNKKGTTWRALSEEEQKKADTPMGAIKLMKQHTSLIRRPVAVNGNKIFIGLDEAQYKAGFKK